MRGIGVLQEDPKNAAWCNRLLGNIAVVDGLVPNLKFPLLFSFLKVVKPSDYADLDPVYALFAVQMGSH